MAAVDKLCEPEAVLQFHRTDLDRNDRQSLSPDLCRCRHRSTMTGSRNDYFFLFILSRAGKNSGAA